jgi:hypothetical protein
MNIMTVIDKQIELDFTKKKSTMKKQWKNGIKLILQLVKNKEVNGVD